MRKTFTTLAVIAAGAAALGPTAVPASADDPYATYNSYEVLGEYDSLGCTTPYKTGVTGQYGAWGNFIDGCTVTLWCPWNVQRCDVNAGSSIRTYYLWGARVTMNQRLSRFEAGGHNYWFSNRSCEGTDHCEVRDGSVLAAGQSVSVTCNGVSGVTRSGNPAQDHCGIGLYERALDSTSKQGEGQCTDWALYRRPDLAGVVSGDARYWTEEARKAGRTVSKTPSQGAVMVLQPKIMGAFEHGHVAYVESVQRNTYGTPTSFVVSQQNYNGKMYPTTQTIPVSSLPASGVDFIG